MEISFIDSVTKYITRFDLQELEIIVPNNRTGSAILASLKKNATKVCWAPKITPIKDVFIKNSEIHEAEKIVLIYNLFKIYDKYFPEQTTLDKFYSLGEIMLSDFDDIDKYLIDPIKLFKNLADEAQIKTEFDEFDGNEEILDALKDFWNNVSKETLKGHKLKTLDLWQKMPEIYNDFSESLKTKGIGYQGLIYRDFVENRLTSTKFPLKNYAFVGFSALNKCEKSLMRHISQTVRGNGGECLFFWDADKYYIDNQSQEAGLFLRDNIKNFPPPQGFEITDNIKNLNKKDVKIIELPTSVAQVKLLPELLEKSEQIDSRTAIILGDEKLLVPLIYSLPETLKNEKGENVRRPYNITMGYPLSYTASASFAQTIMKLAMHATSGEKTYFLKKDIFSAIMNSFTRKYVKEDTINFIIHALDKHKIEYISIDKLESYIGNNKMLNTIFDIENKNFPQYVIDTCNFAYNNILCHDSNRTESDFMHKIITLFTSFVNAIGDEIKFENKKMYYKLMTSLIKQNNIAFDGRSDNNMQILGFMETRCLDFDNVIMLSLNENTFPKSSSKQSLIPYGLRKAFEMPSIEFQDSIFAYYFYRLLQRSSKIRMLYSSDEKNSNAEKSRFLTQIEYELGLYEDKNTTKPKFHETKSYKIQSTRPNKIEIVKTPDIINKIKDLLGIEDPKNNPPSQETELQKNTENNDKKSKEKKKGATPSLLTPFITCPLQFYFQYIEEIKKKNDINEDTKTADFGNLLHNSCYFIYKDYIGKTIKTDDFVNIQANVEKAIEFAVQKVYNVNESDTKLMQEAKSKIIINPLRKYLEKILEIDKEYAPFKIVDLENKTNDYSIKYDVNGEKVVLRGIIDRIDLKEKDEESILRIIDYKTAKIDDSKKLYFDNFWNRENFSSKETVQILTYSEIIANLTENKIIRPYFYSVSNPYDGYLKCHKFNAETKKPKRDKENVENYLTEEIAINNGKSSLREHFNGELRNILANLLDANENFTQTENYAACEICHYNKICNKNN